MKIKENKGKSWLHIIDNLHTIIGGWTFIYILITN